MHRMFYLVPLLCAIALPAHAADPKPAITIEVKGTAPDAEAAPADTARKLVLSPDHGMIVHPDGTVEYIPVSAMPTPPVQPYGQTQVDNGGHALFGGTTVFSTQPTDGIAIGSSQGRNKKVETIGRLNNERALGLASIAVDQTKANVMGRLVEMCDAKGLSVTIREDGSASCGDTSAVVLAHPGNGSNGANGLYGGSSFANWGDQVQQIGWNMNGIDAGLSSGSMNNVMPPVAPPPAPKPAVTPPAKPVVDDLGVQ